jgi:nitronate monooxygenase
MAGHVGAQLAAETCRAGGLGFLAAGHLQDVAPLELEIQKFRELQQQQQQQQQQQHHSKNESDATDSSHTYPLCIGFIGYSTFGTPEGWKRFEYILEKYRPDVVQFFAPAVLSQKDSTDITNVSMAQKYSAKVLAQVGTVQDARQALEAGVDGLIVQGSEAGGHGVRPSLGSGTLSLAANVVAIANNHNKDIPVLAAGGIVDGRGLVAALALGCDGVVLGTRLWASKESTGKTSLKQRLVETESCDDVVRTTAFDQIQNSYSATPWPNPYDSVGSVRNQFSSRWDGKMDELATVLESPQSEIVLAYQNAQQEGNADICVNYAGEGVGLIHEIEPAYDIIQRVNQEAIDVLQSLQSNVYTETNERKRRK